MRIEDCKKGLILIVLALSMVFSVYGGDLTSSSADISGNTLTINDSSKNTMAVVEKIYNTNNCSNECYTIWNATIYDSSFNFLNSISFENVKGQEKTLEYKFEYISGYKAVDYPTYKTTCTLDIRNDTQSCDREINGKTTIYEPIWEPFNPYSKLSGNYIIKLTGYKNWNEDIDWIPTFFDNAKIRAWDWWQGNAPLVYYKADGVNAGDNLTDSSGNGYDANTTFTITPYFIDGKLGNASFFDGKAIFYNSSTLFGLTGSYTIKFWVNLTYGNSDNQAILGNSGFSCGATLDSCWYVEIVDNGTLHFLGANETNVEILRSYTNMTDSGWHHVVLVGNSGTNNLYIDNVKEDSQLKNYNYSGYEYFKIGATHANGDSLNGTIDDISLYNVAWLPGDIATSYNSGVGVEDDADLVPPAIAIEFPQNTTYSSNVQDLNYTLTETNPDSCWYSTDNGATNSTINVAGTNFTGLSPVQGSNNVTIYCNDTSNNLGIGGVVFAYVTDIVTTIISPENDTIVDIENVTFIFNVSATGTIDSCSLILNSAVKEINTTITKNINQTFNLYNELGTSYYWYVTCNDTLNNIGSSFVNFVSIVLSDPGFTGNSTNLTEVPDISNITNFTIQDPIYGQIVYIDNVDLSGGANLTTDVNISEYTIEVNSTSLPALNLSAQITFYNVSFSNPTIFLEDSPCPAEECVKDSYENNIYVFNVTHFSKYTLKEISVEGIGGAGGTQIVIVSENNSEIIIPICGNNICEEGEDISGCSKDCSKFNVDTFTINCLDKDENTFCSWGDSKTITYLFLGIVGFSAITIYISTSRKKKKNKKEVVYSETYAGKIK